MIIGKIYKVTNLINGKIYIGSTKNTLKMRWYSHCRYALKLNSLFRFHRAIRKYGIDNFKLEYLASSLTYDYLEELEDFFINDYDSLKKGYNSVPAGKNRELIVNYMKLEWMKPEQRQLRLSRMIEGSVHRCKPIIAISIYDGHEKIYESTRKIRQEKLSLTDIYHSLKGKTVKSQGYVWFYYDSQKPISYYRDLAEQRLGRFKTEYNQVVIATHVLTGEVIEYPTLFSIVEKGYKIKEVNRVLHGKYETHKKYRWSFKK